MFARSETIAAKVSSLMVLMVIFLSQYSWTHLGGVLPNGPECGRPRPQQREMFRFVDLDKHSESIPSLFFPLRAFGQHAISSAPISSEGFPICCIADFQSANLRISPRFNPKGIVHQSPGLRGTSYPGN